jgi:hypothetical protein
MEQEQQDWLQEEKDRLQEEQERLQNEQDGQHARTGCNIMLHFVTTSLFYGLLDAILVSLQTKLTKFLELLATSLKTFKNR